MLVTAPSVVAQEADPERQVEEFLRLGTASSWLPYEIFSTCPRLNSRQQWALELLLRAELTPQRLDHLALAWANPLRVCQNRQLEGWYFRQIDRVSRDTVHASSGLWVAISNADSPAIREFLQRMAADESLPEASRARASAALFLRLSTEERWVYYFQAVRSGRHPRSSVSGQMIVMLREDPEGTLRELASNLVHDPELVHSLMFQTAIPNALTLAPAASLRWFARHLEHIAETADAEEARALRETAAFLRQKRYESRSGA